MRHRLTLRAAAVAFSIVALLSLAGCGHSDSAGSDAVASAGAVPPAQAVPNNPQAQALAAQHAQGAGADGKRFAAAMAQQAKH